MTSPARAIAWEFRRRHLWVLPTFFGYLLVLAAIKLLFLWPGQPVRLDPPDETAAAVTVPFTAAFCYFLAVFSFGFSGDLAARQSIFPARMFALPVTTGTLAGWPLLFGSAAVTSLWLGTALFARWSWGIDVPLLWPSLLCVVFLAWTQALMWMPYGLPGLRVIGTVLWLAALDAVVLLAVHYKVPATVMVAIFAPQLPLAYLTARYAVARARRGVVPDWRPTFARPGESADVPARPQDHFASPARAQAWFEWRRHGWTLPAWVGILLPFELALLFAANTNTPGLVFFILFGALLIPPCVSAFAAVTVGKPSPHARGSWRVPPFMATRPLTTAALIAAKLRMAIWSTLAAWLLVVVAIPLALTLSDTWPVVIERVGRGIEVVGMPRAIVFALLVLTGVVASTWRQLVQGLCVGLTGRSWMVKSNAFLAVSFLTIIGPVAEWIHDDNVVQAMLWNDLPWILAVLVSVKMCAAAWIATRLVRNRLLSERALVTGAASWVVAVLALYAVLAWLVSGPLIPHYVLVLVAILQIPLVRLSAAPLALAWNRHR